MARLARVVAVGVPHHVTQRGNARQVVFSTDADRLVYLDLLRRNCALHHLAVVGYCLMSNHVHLIVIPRASQSLPLALKHAHGRYAVYFNAHSASSGHLWQGRYYSCPLDETHFWAALRYTELNPVRASIVAQPDDYAWSSAAAHCGSRPDEWLQMTPWFVSWTPTAWREYLGALGSERDAAAVRAHTHTGRPLGGTDFVARLEKVLNRRLAPAKGGRPAKPEVRTEQQVFRFSQP